MSHEELVRKALFHPEYSGHLTASGIFIGGNVLWEEVENVGAAILPAIEKLILEVNGTDIYDEYGLIFHYFLILSKTNEIESPEFLISLPQPAFHHALCAIRLIWRTIKNTLPPQWILNALSEIYSNTKNREVSELLEYLKSELSIKPTEI